VKLHWRRPKERKLLIIETVLALIITLAILVVAHEFGHFAAAKMVGVRVEEFAFGFGPKLVRLFKRGDTEYTIHPIPLGGFVRLSGMEPGEDDEGSDPRSYNAQSIGKRFAIIFAGPLMSFILAYVIFCSLGATIGLPVADSRNEVSSVERGSPAEQAGLQRGDRIIEIDGQSVKTGQDLQGIVFESANKELSLKVQRDSRTFTVAATPKPTKLETPGEHKGKTVGLLGVHLEASIRTAKYGVGGSIVRGTEMTWNFIRLIFETLTSKAGLKDVGGIVAITRVTAEGVKYGPDQLVFQLAALSLTLAILNLVPWPILDGGHILLLFIEFIRRGKKLTMKQLQIFQMFGFATLVALALFLVYIDIVRWVPIDSPLLK
jgi:regulator of sigma E protease